MYIKTSQHQSSPQASDLTESELRQILGKIYDNQFFINKDDLEILKYLSQKGDHDNSPIIPKK
jgi:hypothetical protein